MDILLTVYCIEIHDSAGVQQDFAVFHSRFEFEGIRTKCIKMLLMLLCFYAFKET